MIYRVGTRVKIREDSRYYNDIGQGNKGLGNIIQNNRKDTRYIYRVSWDNGDVNNYKQKDLEPVNLYIWI